MLSDPPRNMLAQSQSGTGKTAAFVTAILSRVDFNNPEQPQALALAPSRELARQIEGVVNAIGHFVENLKVAAAIPGALARNQPVRASVIIGTPVLSRILSSVGNSMFLSSKLWFWMRQTTCWTSKVSVISVCV